MTTSSQSTPDPPHYASAPFDDLDADLILRSSDNIDFRVSRFILRLASPFFASMLEIGQTPSDASGEKGDEVRDGCRVVPVQEDGDTLDSLLRIIYPQKDPILSDLPKVNTVIAAALKYEMEEAIALTGAKLLSFKSTEASRVWAIAVRHGLEPEARAAADELNREKVAVLDDFPPEMQEVNAGAYYRLLQYRRLDGKVESNFKFCYPPSSTLASLPNSSLVPAPGIASLSTTPTSGNHPRLPTDVVCRSSDGKEFPAHKAILAYASPVMAAMLTRIPTLSSGGCVAEGGSTERRDDPRITFDEDGGTLGALVSLSYPIFDGYEAPFLALQKVPETVQKYEMSDAFKAFEHRWLEFVTDDPLTAYLLAASHRSAGGAQQAALRLLDRAMQEYYAPSLERSPASVYRDALLFHRTCKAAASGSAKEFYSAADDHRNARFNLQALGRSIKCTPTRCDCWDVCCNNSCPGLSTAETYRTLQASPASMYKLCISCALLGRAVVDVVDRLNSSSDGLYTTLEVLRGSRTALDSRCSFVPAQDRPTLEKLYSALYDITFQKVAKALSDHIVK